MTRPTAITALAAWAISAVACAAALSDLQHVVVIYQENWSFDGLYGNFPGADGWTNARGALRQTDRNGKRLPVLPPVKTGDGEAVDPRFPANLPVAPYDLTTYVKAEEKTGDLVHRFYTEQAQIHGGRMDRFVVLSDNGGLVLSYYDATNMPEGKLAGEFTLCDRFFHSAFGGSFFNHIMFIAADAPVWTDCPPKEKTIIGPDGMYLKDNRATPDGYAVNTVFSAYPPQPPLSEKKPRMSPIDMVTIGDRLSAANVSWNWYAGGWDDAMAGHPGENFEFHHQPFVYFKAYAPGTPGRAHLKDEKDFVQAIKDNALPAVAFVKPIGDDNEHPGYASLARGQQHVADLVAAIRVSAAWPSTLIIITYDEHGGRFDHVAPPHRDRWGPGSRVPCLLIAPFARAHHIEHASFETLSILKLIEHRWHLSPLTSRDGGARDLIQALDFTNTVR